MFTSAEARRKFLPRQYILGSINKAGLEKTAEIEPNATSEKIKNFFAIRLSTLMNGLLQEAEKNKFKILAEAIASLSLLLATSLYSHTLQKVFSKRSYN